MKEIKFRGLLTGQHFKGWIFWDIFNPPRNMFDFDPKTICQFTGLPDKNGTPIYEGDFVKGYAPDSEKDERFDVMIVEYVDDGFALTRPNPPRLYFHDLASCVYNKSIEVIGNIYSDPHLLNSKE